MSGRDERQQKRPRSRHPHPRTLAAPPGTIALTPGSPRPRVRLLAYSPDLLVEEELGPIAEYTELAGDATVAWLDIEGVKSVEVIRELEVHFGFHPLVLEDMVNGGQRPKAEDYDHYVYVTLQLPAGDEGLPFEQLNLLLAQGIVVTAHSSPGGKCLEAVRERMKKSRGRIRAQGADYLAYAIIDTALDFYFPLVERVNDQLDAIEERLVANRDDSALGEIHDLRGDLHHIRGTLAATREALGNLAGTETELVSAGTRVFLRDCQDHAAQLLDSVEVCRELSVGLMELHQALAANRLNDIMRVTAIISTVFMPLSFIAGVYGMNFDRSSSPWNMPELGSRYGYPLTLLAMLTITSMLAVFFWKQGWLSPRATPRKLLPLRFPGPWVSSANLGAALEEGDNRSSH